MIAGSRESPELREWPARILKTSKDVPDRVVSLHLLGFANSLTPVRLRRPRAEPLRARMVWMMLPTPLPQASPSQTHTQTNLLQENQPHIWHRHPLHKASQKKQFILSLHHRLRKHRLRAYLPGRLSAFRGMVSGTEWRHRAI